MSKQTKPEHGPSHKIRQSSANMSDCCVFPNYSFDSAALPLGKIRWDGQSQHCPWFQIAPNPEWAPVSSDPPRITRPTASPIISPLRHSCWDTPRFPLVVFSLIRIQIQLCSWGPLSRGHRQDMQIELEWKLEKSDHKCLAFGSLGFTVGNVIVWPYSSRLPFRDDTQTCLHPLMPSTRAHVNISCAAGICLHSLKSRCSFQSKLAFFI